MNTQLGVELSNYHPDRKLPEKRCKVSVFPTNIGLFCLNKCLEDNNI